MYHCPKEREVALNDGWLDKGLAAKCCPSCGGSWILPEVYQDWQRSQHVDPEAAPAVAQLPLTLETDFRPAPMDNRAALCPDCRHYLVRGRVTLKSGTFFVERCPNCSGIWCDRGEWEVLQQLGLDRYLHFIFASEWQAQVRRLEQDERERQATVDKLGPEIAQRIFELAEALQQHPNGDFGVAYLMRCFEEQAPNG